MGYCRKTHAIKRRMFVVRGINMTHASVHLMYSSSLIYHCIGRRHYFPHTLIRKHNGSEYQLYSNLTRILIEERVLNVSAQEIDRIYRKRAC